MRFGLQVYSFTWPGGPEAIGPTLARVARDADEAGFDSIWVMDHFWQIGAPGSETQCWRAGLHWGSWPPIRSGLGSA
jgi:alkanesulfonate monooxygenase SsuD/methylene tetrahydromethanopterin reductase-like flavin-dependent oxidoreductase (luciferase family)